MNDDTEITPAQMALAVHGAVIALMKACVRHGLPLDLLLTEMRQSASVLTAEQAAPAAEVLRHLAAVLESDVNQGASRE